MKFLNLQNLVYPFFALKYVRHAFSRNSGQDPKVWRRRKCRYSSEKVVYSHPSVFLHGTRFSTHQWQLPILQRLHVLDRKHKSEYIFQFAAKLKICNTKKICRTWSTFCSTELESKEETTTTRCTKFSEIRRKWNMRQFTCSPKEQRLFWHSTKFSNTITHLPVIFIVDLAIVKISIYVFIFSDIYREYQTEVIKSFYRTLQQLLNDNPDCKDYCELVYYEGEQFLFLRDENCWRVFEVIIFFKCCRFGQKWEKNQPSESINEQDW